ncbi:MAG: hypothetical protein AAF380_03250 [Bacteroidota bacterium]
MFSVSDYSYDKKRTPNIPPTEKYKKITYDQPVVVFDIDRVIAKPWKVINSRKHKELAQAKKKFDIEQDKHFLDVLGYPHQIYIGTYALLRALKAHNVEIAFFSSGVEERNVLLVQKLYEIAFEEEGQSLFEKTSIYSRHHCVNIEGLRRESDDDDDDDEKEAKEFLPHIYKAHYCQLKKDLRILLLDPKTATERDLVALHRLGEINPDSPKVSRFLKNVVLIEDDYCYMAKNQEHNLLYLKGHWEGQPFQAYRHAKINLKNDDMLIDYYNIVFKDFYHLFYAYYVLEEALHLYKQGMPFRDAMASIQMRHNDKEAFEYERKTPFVGLLSRLKRFCYNSDVKLSCYKKGLKGLKPYWPTLDFAKVFYKD